MTVIVASATGGNWNAGAAWIGGVTPTSADDVQLNALSGPITITGTSISPNACRSMDCTGYTNTFTHPNSTYFNIGDTSGGSLTASSGMTYTAGNIARLSFVSTTTGNTITTAGKTIGGILSFNGVGGAWALQDNLTTNNSATFTAGAVDLNGKTLSVATAATSGSGTKSLTFNGGVLALTITAGTNQTILDFTVGSGFSLTADTGTISSNPASGTAPQTLNLGTYTYHHITIGTNAATYVLTGAFTSDGNITITEGGLFTIQGAISGVNLSFTGGAVKTDNILFNGNVTLSGTFTCAGNNAINRVLIGNATLGTARTVSAATFTFSNVDLADITKAGAGSGNIAAITGLSGDCGGNTGWTFTTGINCYMKTAVSVSWSASNWFTASGGATPARVPLPQDVAIFDANSVTATSKTITQDMPRIGGVNWTGIANNPAWAKTTSCRVYGNITLVSGMTNTGTSTYSFRGRGSQTFTSNGRTWTNPFTLNAATGTYTLADAFVSTSTLTALSGTLTGSSTVSFAGCTIDGGTFNLGGTLTSSADITISGGDLEGASYAISGTTLTMTSGTLNIGTLTLSTSGSFTGGTMTAGSGGVSTPTFSITGSTARTLNMGSGTWTLSGNANVWDATTVTNLTLNPSTSTISITNTTASPRTFIGGTATYYNISTVTTSNGTLTFSGAFTGHTLTLNPGNVIIFTKNTTYTFTSLSWTGSAGNLITIKTDTSGTAATVSVPSGTINADYLSLKDNHATGGATFNAGIHSTDVSGNTGWNFGGAGKPLPFPWNFTTGNMKDLSGGMRQ